MTTPFRCPECGCPLPRESTATVPTMGWPNAVGYSLPPIFTPVPQGAVGVPGNWVWNVSSSRSMLLAQAGAARRFDVPGARIL